MNPTTALETERMVAAPHRPVRVYQRGQGPPIVFVHAPSPAPVEMDGVDIITIADGLVRSKHTYIDSLAIRQQLRC